MAPSTDGFGRTAEGAAIAERVAEYVAWGRGPEERRRVRDRAESVVQAILHMGGTVTLPPATSTHT